MRRQAILFCLVSLLVWSCGSNQSAVVPGLPGDGTANLGPRIANTPTAEPEPEIDLWEDKELIKAPAAKAPSVLSLPEVMHFTLKNGLQVIAVPDSALPVTSIQIAVKTGKGQAVREKVGLADFTAQAMTRGTKRRDAARIAKEVESIGGHLQASATFEATLFSCKSLSKDLKTCMTILPDILANPKFPESELDLIRRNMHATVRQRRDDAGQLASAHFQSALWGDNHVRGWVMSDGTIDAIARQDLVDWHKRWMLPNNAVMAISGNFDSTKIQSQLERAFAPWRKGNVEKPRSLAARRLQGLRIRLVDKPGQTQSHIRVGHYGIAHDDPDFYSASAFNYTLGGGQFSSRLMKVVRSAEGKAYTASSRLDRNRDPGAFVAGTFTRSSETVATIKLMLQVISEMASKGPSEEELAAAITNIAGSYATRFETAGDLASALLAADLHDFNDQYVSLYPLNIAKVTRQQAANAAARILDPVNFVMVITGDAKVVAQQLKAVGWGYELVSHTDPVSNWERAAIADPVTQPSDPAAVAAATKLLNAALEKKGGLKRLQGLKSYLWEGSAALNLPTGPIQADVHKRYFGPDKLRLDMEISAGQVKIATVLQGAAGWAREESPRGKKDREFTPLELEALSTQLWRDSELVLLRHTEAGAKVAPAGTLNIQGKAAIAVTVSSPTRSVTLLIDAKSKLLVGMDYSDQGAKASERFSDYKKSGGIMVAHTRTTKSAMVDMKVLLKSVVFDKGVSTADFLRPSKSTK
jgi:zinc protease